MAPPNARMMTSWIFMARSRAAAASTIVTSLIDDGCSATPGKSGHFTCSRERTDHVLPTDLSRHGRTRSALESVGDRRRQPTSTLRREMSVAGQEDGALHELRRVHEGRAVTPGDLLEDLELSPARDRHDEEARVVTATQGGHVGDGVVGVAPAERRRVDAHLVAIHPAAG